MTLDEIKNEIALEEWGRNWFELTSEQKALEVDRVALRFAREEIKSVKETLDKLLNK
mgnify:FL=1